MLFSEKRRRVAHALRPSTVRSALKEAKQSVKARLARPSWTSARKPTTPEATTSTRTEELRTETSAISSLAQTSGAIVAASLGYGLVCVTTRPLSFQPAPICTRVDTSSVLQLSDTQETEPSSVKEEAPQAVAPSIEATLANLKVKSLTY